MGSRTLYNCPRLAPGRGRLLCRPSCCSDACCRAPDRGASGSEASWKKVLVWGSPLGWDLGDQEEQRWRVPSLLEQSRWGLGGDGGPGLTPLPRATSPPCLWGPWHVPEAACWPQLLTREPRTPEPRVGAAHHRGSPVAVLASNPRGLPWSGARGLGRGQGRGQQGRGPAACHRAPLVPWTGTLNLRGGSQP